MVERDRTGRIGERGSEIEAGIVWYQRAGDHPSMILAAAVGHHPTSRAHHVCGRFAEDAPAGFGDL